MAAIEVQIASRRYVVACKDGEEDSLREAAALVDQRARTAAAALGTLSEARLLLLAALLLADDVREKPARGVPPAPVDDRQMVAALEALADRVEAMADQAEAAAAAS